MNWSCLAPLSMGFSRQDLCSKLSINTTGRVEALRFWVNSTLPPPLYSDGSYLHATIPLFPKELQSFTHVCLSLCWPLKSWRASTVSYSCGISRAEPSDRHSVSVYWANGKILSEAHVHFKNGFISIYLLLQCTSNCHTYAKTWARSRGDRLHKSKKYLAPSEPASNGRGKFQT